MLQTISSKEYFKYTEHSASQLYLLYLLGELTYSQ